MRVLVVDDSEIDTLLTCAALERAGWGAAVETAELAATALERLSRPDASPVDLILLDLNMPGMNGFEFIEAFERMPSARTRAAVVVLSNSPLPEDRENALAHWSVRDYIVKPLSVEAAAALHRVVQLRASTG